MNVVPLLSQKLLQKKKPVFVRKNGYFWVYDLWRPNRWLYIKSGDRLSKDH